MKKHANIPIFIPHMGCKNECVFCNQRRITGRQRLQFDKVREEIEQAVSTIGQRDVQIAFFGGSFTGIERDDMIKLLEIGKEYIDKGLVSSLRCSTRPDYISPEILEILKSYGMKSIELGIQSTSDRVLLASGRGHTAQCAIKAMHDVKNAGFELVGQMMTSLPSSTLEDELKTAEDICACHADGARIYPTVVFKDTRLAEMAQSGEYSPTPRCESVHRAAEVKKVFISHGVSVLRVGLSASETLCSGEDIACGEYDESVGERAESEIFYSLISQRLDECRCGGELVIAVAPGCVSHAVGIRCENKKRLMQEYGYRKIKVIESASLGRYEVRIIKEGENVPKIDRASRL